MTLRLLFAAALVGALFAGCLDDAAPAPIVGDHDVPAVAGALYKGTGQIFAGAPLYTDPQNAPHPAFNFPTLANPATGPGIPESWAPIAPTALPEHISALTHIVQAEGVTSGAGIAVFGSLVVVPGFGADTSVVDISDPAHPKLLSQFKPQEGLSTHRGAAFIPYPTGQLVVVISTGAGIDVWDLTEPVTPKPRPFLLMNRTDGSTIGSHKVGVIPGTPIVVNAASDGGARSAPEASTGVTQMWDLSNPQDPFRLPDFQNGYSCHHVYFWNNPEEGKFRGVCAGVQYTQIWDTADPYNPSVVVSVPFGTGGTPADVAAVQFSGGLSHYAGLSLDGKVLIMGDESGGGSTPPGCTVRADTPVGGISPPIGAVWFYDVSDETSPRLLSWISASQLEKMGMEDDPQGLAPRSCTAHHGRLVPIEGRDVLAMSFYGSGVVVIDFTAVRGEGNNFPTVVAQYADHSDTWETWYYQGYLFTGDLTRGMDVLSLA